MCGRHTHVRVDRGRRSWTVRSSRRPGVVLRPAPAQANPRVPDRITLHLVDGHLSRMSLDELDESTALSRWDLDVSDFAKALEERAELILGDVAGETTNKYSGVVGVSELVHRLRSTVVAHRRTATHGRWVHPSWGTTSWHTHRSWSSTGTLVLRSCGRDAHRTVAAVDTLHLAQSTLLVILIGEANETISTGHSADGIGHDLRGFARREAALEQGYQDVFIDLGAKITNEDGEFGSTVITAMKVNLTLVNAIKHVRYMLETHLRSANPPPEAQLSLNGRVVLGI